MKDMHRTEFREKINLPVRLVGGGKGVTKDISATGLFFQTDNEQRMGGLVEVEIELDSPGGPMKLKAWGQIVRVEHQAGKTGMAMHFENSRLVAAEDE